MPNYYGYQPNHDRNLQHGKFKYIKREWKNGKWKYWYDDVKKDVSNTVNKITGKTNADYWKKHKESADATVKAREDQFRENYRTYKQRQEVNRKAYMEDRKKVTEAERNRQYAKKMLPGHMDKADANVEKAKADLKSNNAALRENPKGSEITFKNLAADDARMYKQEKNYAENYAARYAKSAYDNSLEGRIENTKNSIKKTANDVADWASDTYDNVSKTATKAIDNGKKWAKNAAEDVGDWANDTSKKAAQAVDNGAEWVKNLLGGKKKKKKK